MEILRNIFFKNKLNNLNKLRQFFKQIFSRTNNFFNHFYKGIFPRVITFRKKK